jgi:hypothetical protein
MADVFLSYAREDTGAAEKLAWFLTNNGLDVWWDRRLSPGDDISIVIERALEQAQCAIVLWSPHSVASPWVRGEAQAALDLDKLVPLQIAECKLPINFRHLHTPQIYKSNDQLSDLAKLLTKKLAGGKAHSADAAPPIPASKSSNNRRTIVFEPETTNAFLSDWRKAYPKPSDTISDRWKKQSALWKKYPGRMALIFTACVAVPVALNLALEESSMDSELKLAIQLIVVLGGCAYFYFVWPRKG